MAKFRVWIEPTRKGSFRVRTKLGRKFLSVRCVEKYESATINGKLLVGKTLAKVYAKQEEDRLHKQALGDFDLSLEIESLTEKFIKQREVDRFEQKTLVGYRTSFRTFLEQTLCKTLNDLFKKDLFVDWKSKMYERKYTPHTMRDYLSVIRTWLNWLKESKYIAESPFGKKIMPMKKAQEPKYYSTQEWMRLDLALAQVDHSTRIVCNLAHSAGLRKEEACGVMREDITWHEEGADLLLRKEVVKGKTNPRTVPLDPSILALLGSRKTGLLAPFANVWACDHYFAQARKIAQIKKGLHIHGLRHTFAKNYLQRGEGNLASLQKLLGHRSIASTEIYAQFEKDYLRSGIQKSWEARMRDEGIIKSQLPTGTDGFNIH